MYVVCISKIDAFAIDHINLETVNLSQLNWLSEAGLRSERVVECLAEVWGNQRKGEDVGSPLSLGN